MHLQKIIQKKKDSYINLLINSGLYKETAQQLNQLTLTELEKECNEIKKRSPKAILSESKGSTL